MTRILLSGCCGKMGTFIREGVKNRPEFEIVGGVDVFEDNTLGFPVFNNFDEVKIEADVIIDFSRPALLPSLLQYAVATKTPAVIATTGLTDEDILKLNEASKNCAFFFSYNMSIGVNLICELAKSAAKVLGNDFDIEITEAHHNQKVDAPSGTALMIADSVKEILPDSYCVYDRHSVSEKRKNNEIGMHSIRGGTIVGEHEIMFAGDDEIIKISHSARSRKIFATGALNAALFLQGKSSGVYSMKDMLK